jgi:hypothetical protein
MSTIFNINRLGLLLKRYFVENKQRELLFWGIATVIFMIMHQSQAAIIFLFIGGFIFASQTYKIFGYTPGGMHYLLIPATHLEKLITTILLSTVYYFGVFLISYTIGTTLGTIAQNLIFNTTNPVFFDLFQSQQGNMNLSSMNGDDSLWSIFIAFAINQAIFTLGSLYFKRNAIAGTFLSMIAVGLTLMLVEIALLKFTFGTYSFNGIMYFQSSFSTGSGTLSKIMPYLLLPFLWIVSYFRLTEKEV